MEEESSDEFSGRERYGSFTAGVAVVACQEGDLTIIHLHKAVVGDGHLVRVESEVSEDLFRSAKGLFGIDDPFDAGEFLHEALKGSGIEKMSAARVESEPLGVECLPEEVDEFSSEFSGKCAHGDEKVVSSLDPSGLGLIQAAARGHNVEVGMELKLLVPGVQNGGESYMRS